MLACRGGRGDTLTLRARLVDPGLGIDEPAVVTVEDGVVTAVERASTAPGSLIVAPAFVDPHVHLRTPGREDEETIASGTEAAAAGGYCAIVAMPNTDPVVDTPAVLQALVEQAHAEAVVPTGFTAAISKGQRGEELTEMAALAAAGALAFTDDGRPVASAGLMRRALAYSAVAARPLALHCEEPTLSAGGQMHEGAVSAELGLAGWPSVAESLMVERDLALAAYEARPVHLQHLSARESVDAVRRRPREWRPRERRGQPASPLRDRRARAYPRRQREDEPAAPHRGRPARARRGPARRHDRLRRDRPRAARTPREGRAVRGGAVRRHRPRDGVRRAEHVSRRRPARCHCRRCSNGCRPGLLGRSGCPCRAIAVGEPANLVLLDLEAEWTVREESFRSRSANSWLLGRTLVGAVVKTVADGRVVFAA